MSAFLGGFALAALAYGHVAASKASTSNGATSRLRYRAMCSSACWSTSSDPKR